MGPGGWATVDRDDIANKGTDSGVVLVDFAVEGVSRGILESYQATERYIFHG